MTDLKIGMIGLDTSHCPAFCNLINNEDNPHHVSGGKVLWAYPGGSTLFEKSISRVPQFTEQLRDEFHVEILDSIEAVAEKSDAILLESVDGRQHLEQFKILAPYGKPVYIDKPLACSTTDAKAIMALSEQHNAPVFSASSLRYVNGLADVAADKNVVGVTAHGIVALLDDYPGYFWYGVHTAEILFAILGAGCKRLSVTPSEKLDTIVAEWDGGRRGVLLGYRLGNISDWGVTVFADDAVIQSTGRKDPPGYALLLPKVMEFFQTGRSPVSKQELLEVVAFLEAIDTALQSGEPVDITI